MQGRRFLLIALFAITLTVSCKRSADAACRGRFLQRQPVRNLFRSLWGCSGGEDRGGYCANGRCPPAYQLPPVVDHLPSPSDSSLPPAPKLGEAQ
jgi:hypothetical protein